MVEAVTTTELRSRVSVRKFTEADIAAVAALHESIFPNESGLTTTGLRRYINDVFLDNPWYDDSITSLVCEEDSQIVAFAGVLPRPMRLRGRRIRGAVLTQFITRPDRKGTAALVLLRFLAGPQDLSFSDGANDLAHNLWKRARGNSSLLFAMHWFRVIKPAGFVLQRAGKRPGLGVLARLGAPVAPAIDAVLHRLSKAPWTLAATSEDEPLSPDELVSAIEQISDGHSLVPEYEPSSASWLLHMAAYKDTGIKMRARRVVDGSGSTAGWYVYLCKPGGISHVLQLGAHQEMAGAVLDHLFSDASKQHSVAVSGRMQPEFAHQLWSRTAVFGLHGAPFLYHTRDSDIQRAIETGDIFLSRLDGEWWMRFRDRAGAAT